MLAERLGLDAAALPALRSDGVVSPGGAWLDSPARRQHDGGTIPKLTAERAVQV